MDWVLSIRIDTINPQQHSEKHMVQIPFKCVHVINRHATFFAVDLFGSGVSL